MLRKLLMLFGVLLIILSACGSNAFTFSGETNNWSAILKVIQHSNNYEEQEFELQYKEKDINSIGDITFNIDTNAGSFNGSGYKLEENGVIKISNDTNPTNAKIIESSEVEVTVEWNGNIETIMLRNH